MQIDAFKNCDGVNYRFFAFLLLGFDIPNERHGQTRSRTKNSRNQRQKQRKTLSENF